MREIFPINENEGYKHLSLEISENEDVKRFRTKYVLFLRFLILYRSKYVLNLSFLKMEKSL